MTTERIEWMTSPGRLAEAADAWDSLVRAEATPFADAVWFDCWWRAFGDGAALRVCALWQGEDLVAALPLAARGRHMAALSNFHTPVFRPPARDADALERVIDAVLESGPDDLRLHAVPAGDTALEAMRRASTRRHRLVLAESQHVSPIVETTGGFDDYRRQRGQHVRDILRRRRKLHREHDATFVFEDDPPDLDAALDRGFVVEATDWKVERGTAVVSTPASSGFYRQLAHVYRARGELRLAWLHVDGRAAAFALCLLRGPRLFLLKHGFDTTMSKLSPGLVLHLHIVERCFELGYEAYELLGEEERWKSQFATSARPHERIWSFGLRPLPLGRYAFRRAGLPLARAARRRLQDTREVRAA
jgi:CelD/BcsL family acetyltransferase involved in cellulose biosynthesis